MSRLTPLLVALSACAGSSSSVVVDQRPTHVAVDAHQEIRVDQRVEIRVDRQDPRAAAIDAGHGGYPICRGLNVTDGGETRPGRALAMALLQVSARPWVDLAVDGVPQGRTPLVAVGVEAGPREIRLTHPGYTCTFRLHAHAGRRYSISADVEAR